MLSHFWRYVINFRLIRVRTLRFDGVPCLERIPIFIINFNNEDGPEQRGKIWTTKKVVEVCPKGEILVEWEIFGPMQYEAHRDADLPKFCKRNAMKEAMNVA